MRCFRDVTLQGASLEQIYFESVGLVGKDKKWCICEKLKPEILHEKTKFLFSQIFRRQTTVSLRL